MSFEFSICIPTWNKAEYLKTTLDSVFCQIDDDIKDKIEICISDDASQDNTKALIENYQKKYPHIKSFYFQNRVGAGQNFFKSISLAVGKYCCLMGGDDIFEPDGIKTMLNEFKNDGGIDIYHVNFYMYFKNMTLKRKSKHKFLKGTEIFDNCLSAVKNAALDLGQITSIIFKKESWDDIDGAKQFYDYSAPHLYPLWSILKKGGKLKYISKEIVGYRCENSFFAKDDAYERFYILTAQTRQIAEAVFGKNSKETKSIDKDIIRDHIFTAIVFFGKLSRPRPVIFSIKSFKLMFSLYWKQAPFYLYLYKIIPALLCPAFVLKFVRFIYRKLSK